MIRATALAMVLTFASTTLAAPAPPPSSEARAMAETLFFTARGLMEAGRYAEACQKFTESYRLDPAAGTLLNLAVCHEKEGKLASAWGEFKQALNDASKADRPDREELAAEHIAAIEPELPFLTIEVAKEARVPGLEVVRNGSPLQTGAWGTELPVDPGAVEIIVRAPGYVTNTQKLNIERKQHLSVTIQPLEKAKPPPPVAITPVLPPETGWTTKRTLGFALIGVGIVGLGTGSYFGVRAADDKSKSDDACPLFDGQRRCTTAGSEKMSDAQRNAWISNIGIGVGVASVAVGTYLFITGARTERDKHARIDWNVGGGPTGVQASFLARF